MDVTNQISIIIVTYNREKMLRDLLDQLNLLVSNVEIILVNNSNESLNDSHIPSKVTHFIHKKFSSPAAARNAALEHATKEWVLFFDDDIILPDHYFQQAIYLLEKYPNIDIFGGPDQTPIRASYFQQALGLALQSPMTTAHTRLRHLKQNKTILKATERDLILCHLWIRRSFLKDHDLSFPESYFRNEENLLIHQAQTKGAEIYYFSDLFVFHYRKANLVPLAFAVFRSGFYRIKSIKKIPSLSGILFLIPSFWIIFIFCTFTQLLENNSLHPAYVQIWALYIFLSVAFTLKVTIKRPQYFFVALLYQIMINLLYGLGTLTGLLRLLLRL